MDGPNVTFGKSARFDCMPLVVKYCINIQSITSNIFFAEEINILSNNCENLSELKLDFHLNKKSEEIEEKIDEELTKLFYYNAKLRTLVLKNFTGTGDCLLELPWDQMEKINILESLDDISNEDNVLIAIQESTKLNFFKYTYANENIIRALECSSYNLIALELHNEFDRIKKIDTYLSHIFQNNKKLKSIKLRDFRNLTGECLLSLNKNTIEEIELTPIFKLKKKY